MELATEWLDLDRPSNARLEWSPARVAAGTAQRRKHDTDDRSKDALSNVGSFDRTSFRALRYRHTEWLGAHTE